MMSGGSRCLLWKSQRNVSVALKTEHFVSVQSKSCGRRDALLLSMFEVNVVSEP